MNSASRRCWFSGSLRRSARSLAEMIGVSDPVLGTGMPRSPSSSSATTSAPPAGSVLGGGRATAKKIIDTGKARLVFRDFRSSRFTRNRSLAAWPPTARTTRANARRYRQGLTRAGGREGLSLQDRRPEEMGQGHGLDTTKFNECVDSNRYGMVLQDKADGDAVGIRGRPRSSSTARHRRGAASGVQEARSTSFEVAGSWRLAAECPENERPGPLVRFLTSARCPQPAVGYLRLSASAPPLRPRRRPPMFDVGDDGDHVVERRFHQPASHSPDHAPWRRRRGNRPAGGTV